MASTEIAVISQVTIIPDENPKVRDTYDAKQNQPKGGR